MVVDNINRLVYVTPLEGQLFTNRLFEGRPPVLDRIEVGGVPR